MDDKITVLIVANDKFQGNCIKNLFYDELN